MGKSKLNKILEVGCGQGFVSYCLSRDNRNKVIGIDISKEDLEIAQKRYPQVDFRYTNAEHLPFNDETFDQIYSFDVLEHVHNLHKVLEEIVRVLKKDGKIILNVPAKRSEQWLLKIRPTYFKEIHHVRIFENNELETILSRYHLIMKKKKNKGFLQHIEFYYLFKVVKNSKGQLGIGNWRDHSMTMILHILMIFFDPTILHVPLRLLPPKMWLPFPMWFFTFPVGFAVNFLGDKVFPKSIFYEFEKT